MNDPITQLESCIDTRDVVVGVVGMGYVGLPLASAMHGAGVRVMLFRGGLLHTKTLVADRRTTLIGTVNLDMRSLWLNFEVTLVVFSDEIAGRVRDLQDTYAAESVMLLDSAWKARSFHTRLIENIMRLLGPLL